MQRREGHLIHRLPTIALGLWIPLKSSIKGVRLGEALYYLAGWRSKA